jgi:hypothetical protein
MYFIVFKVNGTKSSFPPTEAIKPHRGSTHGEGLEQLNNPYNLVLPAGPLRTVTDEAGWTLLHRYRCQHSLDMIELHRDFSGSPAPGAVAMISTVPIHAHTLCGQVSVARRQPSFGECGRGHFFVIQSLFGGPGARAYLGQEAGQNDPGKSLPRMYPMNGGKVESNSKNQRIGGKGTRGK